MKRLEIHVDVLHPDLRRHDGTLDPAKLRRVLELVPERAIETVLGSGAGSIPPAGRLPLVHWFIAERGAL